MSGGAQGWADRLGVLDLETTGVDPRVSRIVSACVATLDRDGAVVESRSWLVDPGVEVPAEATAVHGIDTARARETGMDAATAIAQIVEAVRGVLGVGVPIVAYNAPFDLGMLHHEALRLGVDPLVDPAPVIDPLVLDRVLEPTRAGARTLAHVAEVYGVPLEDPHDPTADAVAAGRIAQAMARIRPDVLEVSAGVLHDRQRVWSAEQASAWAEWLRSERGVVVDEPDGWPVAIDGTGRHRARPLRISAAVIERQDGALLFVRKRGTTALMQPGGKPETGETGAAALVRELREELDLVVREDQLVPIGRFSAPAANEPGVIVDALVYDAPLTGDPVAAAEIDEVVWLAPDDHARELAPLSADVLLPRIRERRP